MIKVSDVEHAGGHKLKLRFSDGTSGVADLSSYVKGPLKPLHDVALFKQAKVKRGALTWPGDLDIASEVVFALAHGLKPPTTHQEAIGNEMEVTLRELRAIAGKSQVDVADAMGVAQGEVSRLEHRDDARLSTLQKYVKALGGELEVVARFGHKSMKLHLG